MSKISELSDGGVIQGGDTLIAVRSGGNVKVTYGGTTTANIDGGTIDGTVIGGSTAAAITGTTITGTSFASSGDMTFGDNDKIQMGAGPDLEIYHDGTSTNFISSATSNLEIKVNGGGNFKVGDEFGNHLFIVNDNGDVQLKHGSTPALKLATTATGIDVTGTVTADNVGIGTSSPSRLLNLSGSGSDCAIRIDNTVSGRPFLVTYDDSQNLEFVNSSDTGYIAFVNGTGAGTERLRISSAGNVGIGTSSPSNLITVNSTTGAGIKVYGADQAYSRIAIDNLNGQEWNLVAGTAGVSNSGFGIYDADAGATRLQIDASGNLLVGKTTPDFDVVGAEMRADGRILATRNGDPMYVTRKGSDGNLINLRKDTTTVGVIGTSSVDGFYIHSTFGNDSGLVFGSERIVPCTSTGVFEDGVQDLGYSSGRFDDIYATNGTIQTSDRNEKQDIEALSDAEQRVAVAAKGLLRKFRWIDSVEAKGDDARIHFGIIAQDLQDAFTSEGLDAGRYAMFISTTWWESTEVIPAVEAQEAVVDEEGNVVEEAVEAQEERTVVHTYDTAEEAPEGSVERTRMGVRYSELLAFIIAAI